MATLHFSLHTPVRHLQRKISVSGEDGRATCSPTPSLNSASLTQPLHFMVYPLHQTFSLTKQNDRKFFQKRCNLNTYEKITDVFLSLHNTLCDDQNFGVHISTVGMDFYQSIYNFWLHPFTLILASSDSPSQFIIFSRIVPKIGK
jgi:hypothetical protein